ncbi:MAG TPA: winged helix-turn-helix transcriptional regulator [Anaerolineales bacterium]|nr:winged helix-turn-helix transcriptional regulator [Anaerolineales bacterium]
MTTSRQKVLSYLIKNRTASAREISRSLKMSAAAVRHHLRILVSDGRLEMESVRAREGRGRPEKVYSIPRAVLGDNLSMLSDALLTEAGSSVRVEALAKHLAGESGFASQPIAKRLNSVVEKLNRMNYHARWEAGAEGPRIHFGHCPYAAVIGKHAELCKMDVNLVSQLIARPVLGEARPETQKSVCPFVFLVALVHENLDKGGVSL